MPYDNDRQQLLTDLAGCSVAMMLSWHEGFGLTGFEAIAAEVPLIISENSGLYQLIHEKLGRSGLGCVYPIKIEGGAGASDNPENFTTNDVENVCNALIQVLTDVNTARRDAAKLKSDLLNSGSSWSDAANQFAKDLELNFLEQPNNQGSPTADAKTFLRKKPENLNYLNDEANSNAPTEENLNTRSAFIGACTEPLTDTKTIRATLVGPFITHPRWYSDRRQQYRLYPDFDTALFRKISELQKQDTFLDDVRLIFRNSLRYIEKVNSVVRESERQRFKHDVLSKIEDIWGKDGQKGPRICCVDTGNLRVEVIYDHCVLSSVRPRSSDPIEGGRVIRSSISAVNERFAFDQLFEANYLGQQQELLRLRNFISSLWTS